MYTYCNVHCYNFRDTNKQIIAYHNKLIQKEEELDTMKKKTTGLQHELEYQHDMFIGIVDKLQGDIAMYQARTKTLTQQLKHLKKSNIRNRNQKIEIKILTKKLQEKENEVYTMELKLSTLKDRLKEQCEELYNKDKIIRSLEMENKPYKVGVRNPKPMTMLQLKPDRKMLECQAKKLRQENLLVVNQTLQNLFTISEKKLTGK